MSNEVGLSSELDQEARGCLCAAYNKDQLQGLLGAKRGVSLPFPPDILSAGVALIFLPSFSLFSRAGTAG